MADSSSEPGATEKKVYEVADIKPLPSLTVVVKERDGDRNPVRGVRFNYWIDKSKEAKSSRTDNDGAFQVIPRPNAEVLLSI